MSPVDASVQDTDGRRIVRRLSHPLLEVPNRLGLIASTHVSHDAGGLLGAA